MKRNPVRGVVLDPVRESLVSSSGGLLLRQTVRLSGVQPALSRVLRPWRSQRAVHDPAKVLIDVATAVALGGDCLADVAVIRAQPEVFGPVASDPTVSRLVAALAADIDVSLPAIRAAHGQAGAAAWARRRPLAGGPGRRDGGQVIIDIDATLASPHDSADHMRVLESALAQLPEHERGQVLVRADTGACSKALLHHVTDLGLEYSVGFPALDTVKAAIEAIPSQAWRAATTTPTRPRRTRSTTPRSWSDRPREARPGRAQQEAAPPIPAHRRSDAGHRLR